MKTEKIIAGLGSGPKVRAGAPTNQKAAFELATKAGTALKRLQGIVAAAHTTVNESTKVYDQVLDATDSKARAKEVTNIRNDLASEKLKEQRELTAEKRIEALRELTEFESRAKAAEQFFNDPAAYLTAFDLGSEKRSRYAEQISGLGDAALKNLAQRAVNNGDRHLAAELLRVNDTRKSDRRPFNSKDLAKALVGEELKEASNALRVVKRSTRDAINLNREFDGMTPRSTSKIQRALDFGDLESASTTA